MASTPGIPHIPLNLNSSAQMIRANFSLSNLLQGEILTLGVVEKFPDNQYLMNLKSMEIMARSDVPLTQGTKLQVKVVSTEPQLLLQVLDSTSATSEGKVSGGVLPKANDPSALIQVLGKAPSSSVLQKAADQPKLQLVPGQTVSVTVAEKLDGNQYKVVLKDVSITATSDVPLKEGDRLQVRVQSLQPQIVFSLADAQKQPADLKINEKLIQWRISPDAITQLAGKSSEFAQNLKSVDLPPGFSGKDVDILIKLLTDVVLSPKTKSNPLFVKNFIEKTGLLLERDLAALAARIPGESVKPPDENLKAMLLKLSEVLSRNLQDTTKLDSTTTVKLQNLALFSSEAVKTLEAGQAVNVVYQQNENGLYLQIPLALGEAYRQADIFIRPDDQHAPGAKKYSSCSVNIFLDLDYLGEIAIDVALQEGRIRCIIKCEQDETRQLLDATSQQLQEALTAIGYGIGRIECVKTSDVAGQKAGFIGEYVLGATDLVNSYV